MSNLFKRETLSGEFLQINPYLVRELKARGLWTDGDPRRRSSGPRVRSRTSTSSRTSVRELFRTAWELPQRSLIDMAADRGAVHRPEPVAQPVHGAHRPSASSPRCTCYAWKAGLKTTYYLRSRPATRIQQATVPVAAAPHRSRRSSDADAVACSLENPETCEACQ